MNAWAVGYFARIAFVVIIAAIGMWCAMRKPEVFGGKSLLCYYGVRLAAMFAFVCVIKQVPSDVHGWYMHAKWMAEEGLFPGKDFLTPYALGFNMLLALSVKCFDSPFAIVVLFELAEIAAVIVLYDAFRRFAGKESAKRILILFLTSPITLYCLWLGAQDESLMLLFAACVFWLIVVGCGGGALFVASFCGFAFTKILSLFFLQPFFFYRKHRHVTLCALGFVGYVILAKVAGVNPFNMVFGRSPGMEAAGDNLVDQYTLGNVWFMFRSAPAFMQNGIFLAVIGLVTLCPLLELLRSSKNDGKLRLDVCLNMMCRWGIIFTMLYRMSFATYCACFLPFIYYFIVCRKEVRFHDLLLLLSWLAILTAKDSLYCARQTFGIGEYAGKWIFGIYTIIYLALSALVVMRFLVMKNGVEVRSGIGAKQG